MCDDDDDDDEPATTREKKTFVIRIINKNIQYILFII